MAKIIGPISSKKKTKPRNHKGKNHKGKLNSMKMQISSPEKKISQRKNANCEKKNICNTYIIVNLLIFFVYKQPLEISKEKFNYLYQKEIHRVYVLIRKMKIYNSMILFFSFTRLAKIEFTIHSAEENMGK